VCDDAPTAAQIVAGGFFPLDRQLGLTESVYSPGMTKDMVCLGGLVPHDQAVKVFERMGQRSVPRTGLWRQNQTHGERIKTHLEREQARVKPERVVLPPPGQDHQRALGISMDRGMVNIRGEGWKEIKVGAVCHLSGYSGPGVVTQTGPRIVTQSGPVIVGQTGPG